MRRLCALARAKLQIARLSAREGGQEALLVPLSGDRFGISIDPTPSGGWQKIPVKIRAELKRHRVRFRAGHELGHALFYRRGADRPRRHVYDSPAQEGFCDLFSRELLVPRSLADQARPTPRALLKLRAECDVSLELAARAVAAAQPGLRIAIWFAPADGEGLALQWASKAAEDSPKSLDNPLDNVAVGAEWLADRRQLLSVE